MLKEKKGKAFLLVFVEQLWKVLGSCGVCVGSGDIFVILKRHVAKGEQR